MNKKCCECFVTNCKIPGFFIDFPELSASNMLPPCLLSKMTNSTASEHDMNIFFHWSLLQWKMGAWKNKIISFKHALNIQTLPDLFHAISVQSTRILISSLVWCEPWILAYYHQRDLFDHLIQNEQGTLLDCSLENLELDWMIQIQLFPESVQLVAPKNISSLSLYSYLL